MAWVAGMAVGFGNFLSYWRFSKLFHMNKSHVKHLIKSAHRLMWQGFGWWWRGW
ncbi:hypothetical protein LP109_03495 [Moraxella bovis]|nr:hypothetical protein [Moraxella bovis]UYZ81912.1 hypothetical protein LP113_04060 [Moraxella bovis]UYZ96106.1 hypothetical protein LP121_06070 [Moraxella bovis]UZA17389.1 hypothetical protein LP109_03495 [Moraxella bovis]UZA30847.1 hypothetical protein LP097_04235 [Moraxella bovis]